MGFLSSIAQVAGTVFGGPAGGAIGGIIGGALDNRSDRKRQDAANAYQDPAAIRARYEAAGFNPLLAFTGNGAGTIQPQVGRSNSASKLIAATLDRNQDQKFQQAQLEQENRRLELMAEELTLKEKSYSAYDRNSVANGPGGATKTAVGAAISPATPLQDGMRTGTNPEDTGSGQFIRPWSTDAEVAEARGGEIGGFLQGLKNIFGDDGYNKRLAEIAEMRGTTVEKLHERYSKPDGKQNFERDMSGLEFRKRGFEGGITLKRPAFNSNSASAEIRDYLQ